MSDAAREGRSSGGMIPGLVKGLATTARSMTRRHHTVEYPDAKPQLPPRSRGVIALTEENCTSCMLCARECPDWCIYIDSHKEEIPATTPGGRARQRNVLDRFAIDFSLCMYCGICIEVCPFDALHWSPEFEYSELDIRDLIHEKGRLGEWMATVPPPPALDPGSADPAELAALSRPARPAAPAAPASRATTVRRAPGTVPTEPATRATPSEPAEPAEPAEPVEPVEPGAAARPVQRADATAPPQTAPADEPARTREPRTRVMPAVAPSETPARPETARGGAKDAEPAGHTDATGDTSTVGDTPEAGDTGDTRELPKALPEPPDTSASPPTVQLPAQRPSGDEQ